MGKLYIKTGMKNEYDIAIAHAAKDVGILTGIQKVADLERLCPDAEAIMSFGMCGGIAPGPRVGEQWMATTLQGPNKEIYFPDHNWMGRILSRTNKFSTGPWFSNGLFNTANTPHERKLIFDATGAWNIDDETLYVAQFAQNKDIPWVVCRNVSDAYLDNVAIASNLLNAHGGVDVWNVIKAFATDPGDMIKIWEDYNASNKGLGTAAIQLGPYFGWK
jgi:nucleoside phosphorylase